MELSRKLRSTAAMFVLFASAAGAEVIIGAQYATPVARYGHFALGQPHEYARVRATTDSGRSLELQLPEDEVFEDLAPRLVRLEAQEPAEILAIVSRRQDGARLVMIRLNGDRLEVSAESQAIGIPMRWLNPVGVVDLDGDGRSEIAIVTTPHLGGTLRVYRRSNRKLVEIAELAGFSNHVYGSSELGLSTPISLAGRMHLLVPDAMRRNLRITALEDGRLVEVGRCALPAPVIGATKMVGPSAVLVDLTTGRHRIVLDDCLAKRVLGRSRAQLTSNLAVVTDALSPPHLRLASYSAPSTPLRYPDAHAEREAIRDAQNKPESQRLPGAVLYSISQPAWARGLTRIELTVREDNHNARALYEHLGFEHEGLKRRSMLVDGKYYDCHSMALLRSA